MLEIILSYSGVSALLPEPDYKCIMNKLIGLLVLFRSLAQLELKDPVLSVTPRKSRYGAPHYGKQCVDGGERGGYQGLEEILHVSHQSL